MSDISLDAAEETIEALGKVICVVHGQYVLMADKQGARVVSLVQAQRMRIERTVACGSMENIEISAIISAIVIEARSSFRCKRSSS